MGNEVEKELNKYEVPDGYSVKMTGEDETIKEAMVEMMKMLGLAVVFIYLIMVAQFQSLLSPFIVMFTMPLAFTGGLFGLVIADQEVSVIALIGFVMLSGFLGAGKTTLIKKLLSEALKGEQVVLIENEFGEIGIDGGFLKESGIEIREMNSGCICCSLVGDFGTSLKEVITTYHPDRIVIEPSGVGKLSDVIKAVKGVDVDCERASGQDRGEIRIRQNRL